MMTSQVIIGALTLFNDRIGFTFLTINLENCPFFSARNHICYKLAAEKNWTAPSLDYHFPVEFYELNFILKKGFSRPRNLLRLPTLQFLASAKQSLIEGHHANA
jgi:hypothetical protein